MAYGASPRAVQALVLTGKIRALLDGRFNVARDDLDALAPAVLRHRMVPNFEAQADGIKMDDLIQTLIEAVHD